MTLRDKAKELIQHTIDDKKLDEKLVLQQTKEELLKLSEDITYASEVLAELKKSGQIDEQKFQSLDTNLRSPEKRKEATQEIANIIDTISARYETMQAEEKEKVKTMTEAIKNSKQSLTGLKAEVLQAGNVDYEKIEKELVDDAAKKLEEHWYSKPFAAGYRKHIHKKVEELKNGKKDADEGRWKKVKSSINDWFYGLIGGMFIGKKIADLIGEKMSKYKDKIADGGKKATERVKDKATDVKDNVKMVAEKSPEALAQQEKTLERYIRNTVKKNFHKDLSDEQLKRVSAKLNLKQQLKDGTSEWSKFMEAAAHGGDMSDLNYMDATLQSMAMPIEIFANLVSVLDEEGIVDIKQAGLTITGNVVEYGLK